MEQIEGQMEATAVRVRGLGWKEGFVYIRLPNAHSPQLIHLYSTVIRDRGFWNIPLPLSHV
jgi:hypothetical protein